MSVKVIIVEMGEHFGEFVPRVLQMAIYTTDLSTARENQVMGVG